MTTYTKFLIKIYLNSLLNVFFVFFSLIFVLNLLTELDFFKEQLREGIQHPTMNYTKVNNIIRDIICDNTGMCQC